MDDRRFQDPSWWNAQVQKYGCSARASDYTEESHSKRLPAIAAAVESVVQINLARILDLPCGVGLLPKHFSAPPYSYTGGDFSPEAVAACNKSAGADVARVVDIRESTWSSLLGLGFYDVSANSGLFCFAELFTGARAAVAFIRQELRLAHAVVANFPLESYRSRYTSGIQCYRETDLVDACGPAGIRSARFIYDYLPHEFIGVFR